jgi:tetratricopeptide (TPR) repeat protein
MFRFAAMWQDGAPLRRAMAISVFLSTVSDEFRAYRDQLSGDLTRQNVAVKVQEDFKDLGGDTLDKLDAYIAECDGVVHLIGDMCGATADARQQRALVAKHSDLQSKLPPLAEALKNGVCLPYTQWEAWLALYYDKPLMIAEASLDAPRGPRYAPSEASRAAQAEHLQRLKAFHRYPGAVFANPDDLAKSIAYSAILDLLVADNAKKAAQARAPSQDEKLDEILKRLSADKSVPLDTLRAILASMGEAAASYNAAEIEQKLAAKASEFRDLADRLNRLSNADPVVVQLRAEASTALATGTFERADQLLADAEARDLSDLQDIEALARQKRLSAADSRAQRAAAALLRINPDAYRQAAGHYGEASRIAAVADALKAREYLRAQASALVRLGDEFGDNAALHEAIKVLEAMPAGGDRAKDPHDWATTQNNLGTALAKLGERESGTGRLEEAVAAFRAGLEEWTREGVPLEWAGMQTNLGNALKTLGERESGTARLEEAVAAYRAALEEWTRERVPLDWAMTQNNLGNALERLGERENGTARLEEAVAAFGAALEERTRERVPLDWAMTQNNLGLALWTLGGRQGAPARLEEAVAAFYAALQERTRDRVPLDWATTQNNLGLALWTLGERQGAPARLEEAIKAYRLALEEFTRERVPLKWAMTQNNLGNALATLGEQESGTGRLEEAVEAYREALKERSRVGIPLQWAASFGNQGFAMMLLADRTNDDAMAETAFQQIQAAVETLRSGGQQQWAAEFEAQLPQAQAIWDRLKGK